MTITGLDTDDRLLARLAAAPPVEPDFGSAVLEVGATVAEIYRIERRVGQGGMGVVYRARDLTLDRPVALKLHMRETSALMVGRLMREAKTMAKLSHPNVLTIYEVGQLEVAHPLPGLSCSRMFIAMEFVPGGTLRDWMEAAPRGYREVTQMFIEAGRGLCAAHEAGVVHRDFKPDNVLIDAAGRPRVADFGLARDKPDGPITDVGDEEPLPGFEGPRPRTELLTTTGTVLGTRAYMAPEQSGAHRSIDGRADQFAFCVSLHEGLHGRRPFEPELDPGPESSVTGSTVPDPVRRVPRRLQRVIDRGLRADPRDRFASMEVLLTQLEAAIAPRALRWVMGATVVSVALGMGGSTLVGQGPVCDAAEQLQPTWSQSHPAQITQAFESTGIPYASKSAHETSRLLDQYAQEWVRQRDGACRSGEEASDLTVRKIGCLDRRKQQLHALVETLLEGGPTAVERAVDAATGLPSPAECDRPEILAAEPVQPDDPQLKASFRDAERLLAQVEAWVATGEVTRATRQIKSLRVGMASQSSPSLRRRVESLAMEVALQIGEPDDAQVAADAAVRAALAAGERAHLPSSTAAQAEVLAKRGKVDEARRVLQMAEAAAEALPGDLLAKAQVAEARGFVEEQAGDFDASVAAYEVALTLLEQVHGSWHLEVSRVLMRLTDPLVRRGDHRVALRIADRGLAIVERNVGPRHPLNAEYLEARGLTLVVLDRSSEAMADFDRALTLYETSMGRHSATTLRVLDNVAAVLLFRIMDGGAADDKEVVAQTFSLLRRILDDLESRGQQDSSGAASVEVKLGQLLDITGDTKAAVVHLERGLALLGDQSKADVQTLLAALSSLGEAYAHLDRLDEGLELLERALEVCRERQPRHVNMVRLTAQITMRLIDAKRYDDARTMGHEALQLATDVLGLQHSLVARLHVQLGRIELATANPGRAVEHLREAEKLAVAEQMAYPSRPGLRYLIALAHRDNGDLEPSRAYARKALETWPEHDHASYGTRAQVEALAEP